MEKEGPDVGLLFVMILGFLLGMVLISCQEKKEPESVIELSKDSKNSTSNVDEYAYRLQICEVNFLTKIWQSKIYFLYLLL